MKSLLKKRHNEKETKLEIYEKNSRMTENKPTGMLCNQKIFLMLMKNRNNIIAPRKLRIEERYSGPSEESEKGKKLALQCIAVDIAILRPRTLKYQNKVGKIWYGYQR